MDAESAVDKATVIFSDHHSRAKLATLTISSRKKESDSSAIIYLTEEKAQRYNEHRVQLREQKEYNYSLKSSDTGPRFRLRPSGLHSSNDIDPGNEESGTISTGSYCGSLLWELIEKDSDDNADPIARAVC